MSFESIRVEALEGNRSRVHTMSVFMSQEGRDGIRESGMDHGVVEGYERLDEVLAGLTS